MSSGMETHISVSYVLQRALSARALKKRQGHGPSERAVVGRIVSMCVVAQRKAVISLWSELPI